MIHIRTIIFSAAVVLAAFGLSFFLSGNFGATAQSSAEQERAQLEAQLKELEAQITAIENDITKTQQEKDTLTNRISILRNQIRRLDLQIEQSNILIGDLRLQIGDTSASIERISAEIEQTKDQMAEVLRHVYQENQKSQVEILLTSATLSDFFTNMAALASLNVRLDELLSNMVELQDSLNKQHMALESEKEAEESFVKIQFLQKQESQGLQAQTQQLLQQTQGKEAEYQRLLADTQRQAQEIRSRIFELIGVPEAPTFGEAVEIAKWAGAQAGVRPALLLAILTQESNLGKNVGQCYIADTASGASVGIRSGTRFTNGMHRTRDLPPFLAITQELGRDPLATPVSCPIPGVGGYGGAMGPAQFIPSTWMLYKGRLDGIVGKTADPWNIRDAFLASALYLSDSGATTQSYNAEWCAAQRYFSGRCSTTYRFYGDSVMNLAARYEQDIKTLEAVR
ncbi:MAG: hypothetical protein A3E08_00260 [Candidatus Wildermuthbacteria bacterium RIFCSPHIGHO2_12_FULL_49_13]|uniref:Membrane protein metalloendopeptidase n=1 Tax=Candidatus Yanofskybacteria bacterium GW2011_GWC1_48_11 TaxID=1619027 RepID=A0A837IQS3_9BACT|nr:MAG: Membrane protein metalloendopeptidase [Candidatus Yanofskybacteria bacterium GW2011_GWC1_48_11]KKW08440.1 MAG: Membrane protein metalloendopeptidase [Parcubacteria group bacterium GW2011_GWA1_49_26]KKW14370.1 MAG: Membrane protein metalloendopeptidase [Parcubacteria group bacterium GW2011_GWA2_50_10]OHA69403.1 MAG: hypothetical protein A3D63_00330 [Candidatus Wildermuthbacteria bacterium RIFCSPHIGHO2_02_FULL_49_17]OHA71608.1 MAG: hypothetical protein A3E08_00260 [Candidatus Wildermuthba